MKEIVEWKEVVDKKLSGYEISTMGAMRTTKYKRPVHQSFDSKQKRSVMLNTIRGKKKKKFFIRDLLYQTFRITKKLYLDDHNTPDINILQKPEQFSKNEDDYGGGDEKEWKEIKKYLRELKQAQENEGS